MKTRILLTILFCGSLLSLQAQQREQSSFDHVNPFNLNNAYAGFDSCIHVFAQRKQQWIGVDGAPVNTQIQGHMPLSNGFGVGAEVSSWSAGLLRSTHISGTVSQHNKIGDNMSLGGAISLGYSNFRFGVDDVIAFDQDNYLNQSAVNGGGFFADLGLLFSMDALQVGVSLPSVIKSNINLDVAGEANEFNVERYFNAHAAYDYALNEELDLRPMFIYRSVPGDGAIADIKAGAIYKKMLGVNLGYRTNNGLLAAVDFTLNDRFRFGYAYDAGMSRLNGISSGSHEFLLGFQMCKAKKEEPIVVNYFTSGQVTDASTGEPLANKALVIRNTKTGAPQMIETDSIGNYRVQVDSGAAYSLEMEDIDFEPFSQVINIDPQQPETVANLQLTHKVLEVKGRVADMMTGRMVPDVFVRMIRGEEVYEAETNNTGDFAFTLPEKRPGDKLDYTVILDKDGYEPFRQDLDVTLEDYKPLSLESKIGLLLTPEKKPEQISEIIDLQPITFQISSAKLTPEAEIEINKVVDVLTKNPEMRIDVQAHTDCTGGEAGNQRLSDQRAKTVVDYIKERISNPERVDGRGYGESKPLTDCACAECGQDDHNLNRRTEFRIVK